MRKWFTCLDAAKLLPFFDFFYLSLAFICYFYFIWANAHSVLFYGSKEFSLHKGANTIGRKAETGHAEVQLCDNNGNVDKYMSRNHAIITIREGGSGLEHHLQPSSPKNPIKVNGHILQNGEIVVLQWGDHLTFGHTELIFEHPHFNEEQTMID